MSDASQLNNPAIISETDLNERILTDHKSTPYFDRDADRKDLENETIRQFIQHKEHYSKKAYFIVKFWLISIAIIIILNSASKFLPIIWPQSFYQNFTLISEHVLMLLIGGTTVSVLGLFAIILRGTFTSKLIDVLATRIKQDSHKNL